MDGDVRVSTDEDGHVFTNPLPALLTGLGCITAALAMSLFSDGVWMGLPLTIGAIATGIGLAIRPREWWVLATGCFNFLVAGSAIVLARAAGESRSPGGELVDESGIYLFFVAAAAAFLGFVLVLVPPMLRRVAISLIIVFHFGGIITAVLAAPPQPWVFEWLWVHVYRPYLQFTYLNNAYHFYAPEPGPASLMWYCVEYEPDPKDGSRPIRWVRVPEIEDGRGIERDDNDTPHRIPHVMFTRRLSLAMSVGQNAQVSPYIIHQMFNQRQLRGQADGIPEYPIYEVPNQTRSQIVLPIERQYREPNNVAKRWVASYARHVALTYKHPDFPDRKVTGVKVYLMEHLYPSAPEVGIREDAYGKEMVRRPNFDDPTYYIATYLGDFDPDGKMKASCLTVTMDAQGNINKYGLRMPGYPPPGTRDPYLYWVIPILYHGNHSRQVLYRNLPVDNYMLKHVGDKNWESIEWWKKPNEAEKSQP